MADDLHDLLRRLKRQEDQKELYLPKNEYARGATMRPTYAGPVSEFIGSILGPQPRGSLQRRLGYEGFTTYEKGAGEGVDYRLLTGLLADPISKAIRPDEKPSKLDYAFSGLPFVPGVGILGKPTQKAVRGIGKIVSPAFDAAKRDTLKKVGAGLGVAALGIPVLKYATKKVVEGPIAQLSSVIGDSLKLLNKNAVWNMADSQYDDPIRWIDEHEGLEYGDYSNYPYDYSMTDSSWRQGTIDKAITGIDEPSKLSDTLGKVEDEYYTISRAGSAEPEILRQNMVAAIDDMADLSGMGYGAGSPAGISSKGALNMVYKELIDSGSVPKEMSDLSMTVFDDLGSTADDSVGKFEKTVNDFDSMLKDEWGAHGEQYDPHFDDWVSPEDGVGFIRKTLTGLMHAEKHNPVALRKAVDRVIHKIETTYASPYDDIPYAGADDLYGIASRGEYKKNYEVVMDLLYFIKQGLK